MERTTGRRGRRRSGLPPTDRGSPQANASDGCLRGLGRGRPTDTPKPPYKPLACDQPQHLPMVRGEPSLVGLVASEEVDFVEAPSTGVVDDGGEQDSCRPPPAGIVKPGALIEAHTTGHLERHHGGDDQAVVPEFVHNHLISLSGTSARSGKAIEGGKEAGAVSPLR